jgi:cytosine permease
VVLGGVALVFAARDGGFSGITSYAGGGPDAGVLSIGAAITVVIAGFVDSGTMTADFTRWSRTGREAVLATLSAFPVANFIALLVGGLIVAAGAATAPAVNGGDFLGILTSHGWVLSTLAVVFVFANLGSVCTHCLYNGAVGWSQLTGSRMRVLTVVLGVIGLIAALAGVWSHFATWLNLLGIFVPPIGAVLIVDQLLTRWAQRRPVSVLRVQPLLAWAIGAAGAYAVHRWAPHLSEAIAGIVIGAVAYVAIQALSGRMGSTQPVPQPAVRSTTRGVEHP